MNSTKLKAAPRQLEKVRATGIGLGGHANTAGSAFSFLRAVRFLWSQFLVFFSETSGIDVTLLGVNNDIRSKSNSNGNMPK